MNNTGSPGRQGHRAHVHTLLTARHAISHAGLLLRGLPEATACSGRQDGDEGAQFLSLSTGMGACTVHDYHLVECLT